VAKFRILVLQDPDAKDRGFSLKGLKLPLTTFCPVRPTPKLLSYDGSAAYGRYAEFWKIPTCLIVLARPEAKSHLRGIDQLLVPTDWCDVAPIDAWHQIGF